MGRLERIRVFVTNYFFVLYMLLAYLAFSFYAPDFLRTFFWGLVFIINIFLVRINKKEDRIVLLYVVFGLLSIIGWLVQPYPFDLFISGYLYSYMPIIFYFIGRKSNEDFPRFYIGLLIGCSFCFIIGYYWLLFKTEWYFARFLEIGTNAMQYNENTAMYARFSSFLDSYHTGNYGACAMCCGLGLLISNVKIKYKKVIAIIIILISFVAIMLCRQRVAMFVGIFILFYFFSRMGKRNAISVIILLMIVVLLPYYLLVKFGDDTFINQIFGRFTEDSTMDSLLEGRSDTWIYALANQRDYFFGHGIGGGGHMAHALGIKPAITDGSYFKILLETGVFSLGFFIYLLIHGLFVSYKRRGAPSVEHMILLFYLFSFIGANIIDFPYIMIPFWFALGRCVTKHYNNKYVLNNITKYE